MNNYEAGHYAATEEAMKAIRVLTERLAAARIDSAEWKEQHENLLAMFRASENRAAKAEAALRACRPEERRVLHSLEGEKDKKLLAAFTPAKTMAPGFELEYWNLTMVRMKGDVVLTVRLPSEFSHYVGTGSERMAAWHPGAVSSVRFGRDLWRSFVLQIAAADSVFQACDSLDGEMSLDDLTIDDIKDAGATLSPQREPKA